MQEYIFATRILYFGGYCEEVIFECNTHLQCECSRVNGDSNSRAGGIETLKRELTAALNTIADETYYVTAVNEM